MRIPYVDGMPKIKMKVRGPKGEREYDAYLDTGASRTLIPETDAIELELPYVGDTTIITGAGKDIIRLYRATVVFLDKEFSILVFGRDLPEQALVNSMIGRDILDHYKIGFDGIDKKIEVLT